MDVDFPAVFFHPPNALGGISSASLVQLPRKPRSFFSQKPFVAGRFTLLRVLWKVGKGAVVCIGAIPKAVWNHVVLRLEGL